MASKLADLELCRCGLADSGGGRNRYVSFWVDRVGERMKKEMVSQTWSFRRLRGTRGTRARVLLEKWDGLEVVWVVGLGVVGFGGCGLWGLWV
ncbi:unnamed protein product [Linum tenue]|uniref:Transmembrane protein n=1 Tax=Linum tenue TaxID=586396 RepID=A0AAV0IST2_9ROSI|nr:unnamed protein product [Linum tenue]